MSVYVDDLIPVKAFAKALGSRWPYATACHLFGDTEEELHVFAASMGLRRTWFQEHPRMDHYDLTRGMRSKAVRAGAIEVDRKFVVGKMKKANVR